jgi:sulfate adenylyltransferase subunit 1 (EFTu-like GTPase family)
MSRQWRRNLRRSVLATRPDAQKQALAETLAWRAMLAAGATHNARMQAAPQLVLLREGLRAEVRQATGIDVAHLQLTERGFEPV